MRRAVLLLALASVAACAAGGRPARQADETAIEVENLAFSDMTVYVVEGVGARRRLGFAPGATTTFMRIPASVVGMGRELHFIVDPIGSTRTAASNRMWVAPGDTVRLTIPRG